MILIEGSVVRADAFAGLFEFENESVDLVFTGVPDLSEMKSATGQAWKLGADVYLEYLGSACAEFSRIIKDKGFVVMEQTDRRINGRVLSKAAFLTLAMQELGFVLKDRKIILRGDHLRKSLFRMSFSDMLVFTRRGQIAATKRKNDYLRDVWSYDDPRVNGASAFTSQFCDLVISTFTNENDVVVDPFANDPSPVVQSANRLKRRPYGITL